MTGKNRVNTSKVSKIDWITEIGNNRFFIYGFVTKVCDIEFDYDFLSYESSQICYELGRQYGCYLKSVKAPIIFNEMPDKLSPVYKNYLYTAINENYISCYA